ncbi:MAG TPA: HEAT repeat domain-containing protein [Thermoanaerobaculia bacterium]|nr:HEAT repeat domain-containing protein [Thermoanaerobaculia bacterium]
MYWPWGKMARLARELADADPLVRENAVDELSSLRSRTATRLLCVATTDLVADVRAAAARHLGNRADRDAIPFLLPLLHDTTHDCFGHTVSYPVRLEAWIALSHLGWIPTTINDHLLKQVVVDEESIANHKHAVYFLGAGFARCYGLPLASEIGQRMLPYLWEWAWPVQQLLEYAFGCRTKRDAATITFAAVLDVVEQYRQGREEERELAHRVHNHLWWWIREEFTPYHLSSWQLENQPLRRFLRFLATNDLANYVITTNWDNFLDIALQEFLRERDLRDIDARRKPRPGTFLDAYAYELAHPLRYVDYGINFHADEDWSEYASFHLYKINGSADWVWCPTCHDIYGRYLPWSGHRLSDVEIDVKYETFPAMVRCSICKGQLQPVLMMPSAQRPQHLLSTAYQDDDDHLEFSDAPRSSRSILGSMITRVEGASLWVFMGYSMPDYDRETVDFVRGALDASANTEIHVVGYEPSFTTVYESPMATRYREVLHRDFEYHPNGIELWIEQHVPDVGEGTSALTARRRAERQGETTPDRFI